MTQRAFTAPTSDGIIAGWADDAGTGIPLLLLPAAEVVLVPGAGHFPWYERPGCVASALTRTRALARLS